MDKLISGNLEWGKVAADLEAEKLKLKSYDAPLLDRLGNVDGKRILDYGSGPGILALALARLGADVRAFDIDPEMISLAGQKIGDDRVYKTHQEIPQDNFDFVICNLVVCINPEEEVRRIAQNIRNELGKDGRAYTGFCNPLIFDVPESQLDFRFPTGDSYRENHRYKKIKKEGPYEIIEDHRPIEWYQDVFRESGLIVLDTFFTPEYEFGGRKIKDFVILELERR